MVAHGNYKLQTTNYKPYPDGLNNSYTGIVVPGDSVISFQLSAISTPG